MLGFMKKTAAQAHISTAAVRMLEQGAYPLTASVGIKNVRKLVESLGNDFREQLYVHRQNLQHVYPPALLNVAGIIEMTRLTFRYTPSARNLAAELLLVSATALHGAHKAGLPDIAKALAQQIDEIAQEYAPGIYEMICPIEF